MHLPPLFRDRPRPVQVILGGVIPLAIGALAGIIVFLVWLWISNIAILLGAEFNAELERGRFIEAGNPPEREPFIEPRDTRKMEDKEVRRA